MAQRPTDTRKGSPAVFMLFFVLIASGIFILTYFGPEFTGFVTFSESVVKTETGSFDMKSSGEVNIVTDLANINAVMLSGTVTGDGHAAVFLVKDGKRHLAYYFEGDAEEDSAGIKTAGKVFTDMCYDTCHLEGLGRDNTLVFELDNTEIHIDKITYLYSRIIDFDLEPRRFTIDYRREPVKMIDLKLTNTELTDYKVLLYLDGPLSSSFSWQGSLIHMTKDQPEKIIPIKAILPDNLPKGTYTHKITARYIPPDTHDFVGESPVAESFITVVNE